VLKLSMKPTGWFQIGWSGEVPPSGVKPVRYFGHEIVLFRGEGGTLYAVDAYCRHLGAHLGYESKVVGECVACPYHGWQWGGDGANTLVPNQERSTRAKLGSWTVREQYGLIWMWHDPLGGPPRAGWHFPDPFQDFDEVPGRAEDYFEAYPQAIVNKPGEPVHPELILENSADCAHFQFTHSAAETPQQDWFRTEGTRWWSRMSFLSPKTKQPSLRLYNANTGIGVTAAMFDSAKQHYRLVLTATPVDDHLSDLRVSYFLPRNGATGDTLPPHHQAFAAQVEELFEQDARIWRHQAFVQKPVYAAADRAGYRALRRWCEQFFEAPEGPNPMVIMDEPIPAESLI
jgi:3-ketosteroid 9alpha-monooxygenase subunit A